MFNVQHIYIMLGTRYTQQTNTKNKFKGDNWQDISR